MPGKVPAVARINRYGYWGYGSAIVVTTFISLSLLARFWVRHRRCSEVIWIRVG